METVHLCKIYCNYQAFNFLKSWQYTTEGYDLPLIVLSLPRRAYVYPRTSKSKQTSTAWLRSFGIHRPYQTQNRC